MLILSQLVKHFRREATSRSVAKAIKNANTVRAKNQSQPFHQRRWPMCMIVTQWRMIAGRWRSPSKWISSKWRLKNIHKHPYNHICKFLPQYNSIGCPHQIDSAFTSQLTQNRSRRVDLKTKSQVWLSLSELWPGNKADILKEVDM